MPILTKEVEVKVISSTVKYYESLGYEIPMRKASESTRKRNKKDYVYDIGKTFTVKIEDLQPFSNVIVDYLCDYCFDTVMSTPYATITNATKEADKIACRNCYTQKVKETCMSRYGVDNYAKTPEFHEKYTEVMLTKYGVEHNSQLPDYREKFHNTCVERYGENYWEQFAEKSRSSFREKTGYNSPLQVPEIKEKSKQTCMERYGYEYALQVPEVRAKIVQSCIEHYGVDCPTKSPEVRLKTVKTFYKNGTITTSKQQLYIYNLYRLMNGNIELNYPVSYYNVDICFPEEKLAVEVDFGGHNLSVKLGTFTQEEFEKREIVRNHVVRNEGYRQMRIISSRDVLPLDKILLQMLSGARQYFVEYSNHHWIEYDIDKSVVRNAEHKDGTAYDYGKLRRIKDSDVRNNDIESLALIA